VDQRKIFTYAEENLPRIGYTKRIHLMNPMVPGLTGEKMSSSDPRSKIDLLDSAQDVRDKIHGAYCKEGELDKNGPLAFSKMVLFPIFQSQGKPFVISRPEKHGGDLKYEDYDHLESDFVKKQLHPLDLKNAVATHINVLLDSIRQKFTDPQLRELTRQAYPDSLPSSFLDDTKSSDNEEKSSSKPAKDKKDKDNKKDKKDKTQKGAGAEDEINRIDLRVGEIVEASKHPEAETLLVEKINVGEAEPRTIVSGIAAFYNPDDLIGKKVVVICNLKPKRLVNIESNGMVLAASTEDHKHVELLTAPDDASAGAKIKFEGLTTSDDRPSSKANDTVMKIFGANAKTNGEAVATYKGVAFSVAQGPIVVKSLHDAHIK